MYSKNLPEAETSGRFRKRTKIRTAYGFGEDVVVVVEVLVPGDEEVLTFVSVLFSVLLVAAGDSFTIVVLFSVLFSAGGLVTVVSFCSQAASNAAPARMQIIFFIGKMFDGGRSFFIYGVGDGDVVVVVVVDSVVVPLGLAAGVTVSVFCSHAASSAAPARMQMYFFIVWDWKGNIELMMNRSKHPFRPY